jgi:hypothetical protein
MAYLSFFAEAINYIMPDLLLFLNKLFVYGNNRGGARNPY